MSPYNFTYKRKLCLRFSASDWVAFDAVQAAQRLGLSVPEDISITGYDGVPPFDHPVFGLTTYRIPVDGMAAKAVEVVDGLIRDEHIDTGGILMHGSLIEGRTAGPVPSRSAAARAL